MADVAENAPFTNPATAISQGKRHLLVRDYNMAVTALAQACELLAEKHGECSDELGEPYLLYGRALLGLAREEAGVLGGGVPGSEEAEEDEEDEEEEDGGEEKQSNVDDKEGQGDSYDETDSAVKPSVAVVEENEEKVNSKANSDDVEESKQSGSKVEKSAESAVEKNKENGSEETEKKKKESNKTDDSKIAEQKKEKVDDDNKTTSANKEKDVEVVKESVATTNGESSTVEQNGNATLKNGEEEGDDVNKEDDEDEVNNLQLAWEVLELAKLVLLKRGSAGWKLLAEAHMLLGEVAMEGGNHQGALMDLQSCLDLLEKIEPCEPRAIAEIHYQLGLAHSLANDFDASIEQFKEATTLLEARIKQLEEITEQPKSDDPFYTTEGEIKELKELLPEIQEKIADMRDFKQEACRVVIEGLKSKVASDCSNGAGTSSDGTCSSSMNSSSSSTVKPASDISHLVRKKRKADESDSELSSPCKKSAV